MELNEAIKKTDEFIQSINLIKVKAKEADLNYLVITKRNDEITKLKKELKESKEELIRYKRYFNLLKGTTEMCVCPDCDGLGGFDYEGGPGEYGHESCPTCKENGLIPKSEIPIKEEPKQESNTTDELDLPF